MRHVDVAEAFVDVAKSGGVVKKIYKSNSMFAENNRIYSWGAPLDDRQDRGTRQGGVHDQQSLTIDQSAYGHRAQSVGESWRRDHRSRARGMSTDHPLVSGSWVTKHLGSGQWIGRTGMVDWVAGDQVQVRFGASGPVALIRRSMLRRAIPEEIAPIMGCRPTDLSAEDMR